jgi:hypothetical protein
MNRFIGYSKVVTTINHKTLKITVTIAYKVFNVCYHFTAESSTTPFRGGFVSLTHVFSATTLSKRPSLSPINLRHGPRTENTAPLLLCDVTAYAEMGSLSRCIVVTHLSRSLWRRCLAIHVVISVIEWWMNVEHLVEWREPKYSGKTRPSATLSARNPLWIKLNRTPAVIVGIQRLITWAINRSWRHLLDTWQRVFWRLPEASESTIWL